MKCTVCYSSTQPIRHLGSVFTVDVHGNVQSWCGASYKVNYRWICEQSKRKLLRRIDHDEAVLLTVKNNL